MKYLFVALAQIGSLSQLSAEQLLDGRCDPPSCVPVLSPPDPAPPWQSSAFVPLTGSEWAIGRSPAQLRARIKRTIPLSTTGLTTGSEQLLIDATSDLCIVTFYLRPISDGARAVWHIEGRAKDWTLLQERDAAACSASLIE